MSDPEKNTGKKWETFTVRLNPEDYQALMNLADGKNQDLAVYVRELIQSHLSLKDIDAKIDARLIEALTSGKYDDVIFEAYLRKLSPQKQN